MSVLEIAGEMKLAEANCYEPLFVVGDLNEMRWAVGTLLTEATAFVVVPDKEILIKYPDAVDPGLSALVDMLEDVATEYEWNFRARATSRGGSDRDEGFGFIPISPWSDVSLHYLHTEPEAGDVRVSFARVPNEVAVTKKDLQAMTSRMDEGLIDPQELRVAEFVGQIGGGVLYGVLPCGAKQPCFVQTLSDYRVTKQYAFEGRKK